MQSGATFILFICIYLFIDILYVLFKHLGSVIFFFEIN